MRKGGKGVRKRPCSEDYMQAFAAKQVLLGQSAAAERSTGTEKNTALSAELC